MSNESGTSSCIYDISQNKKKAFRLDHLGKEKVGLLDLNAKNILKEIIDLDWIIWVKKKWGY